MSNEEQKGRKQEFKLMIDNELFIWEKGQINGSEIRKLGSVPDGVQVWKKNHGHPDSLIELYTVVDLSEPGVEKFSLQEASSGAGTSWAY